MDICPLGACPAELRGYRQIENLNCVLVSSKEAKWDILGSYLRIDYGEIKRKGPLSRTLSFYFKLFAEAILSASPKSLMACWYTSLISLMTL